MRGALMKSCRCSVGHGGGRCAQTLGRQRSAEACALSKVSHTAVAKAAAQFTVAAPLDLRNGKRSRFALAEVG